MSVVTGVTLHTKHDPDCIEKIQKWLWEHDFGNLEEVALGYGGSKHPQIELHGAGYNYFSAEDEFVEFVMTQQWDSPENVVLILNPEEGGCKVYTIDVWWSKKNA